MRFVKQLLCLCVREDLSKRVDALDAMLMEKVKVSLPASPRSRRHRACRVAHLAIVSMGHAGPLRHIRRVPLFGIPNLKKVSIPAMVTLLLFVAA